MATDIHGGYTRPGHVRPPPPPVDPLAATGGRTPGEIQYVSGPFGSQQGVRWEQIQTGVDAYGEATYGWGWVPFGSNLEPPASGGSAADSRNYAAEQAAADAAQAAREQAQRDWENQQEDERRAYEAEQERLQREWEMEQQRLRLEEEARQGRLRTLTELVTNFASNQQKSRELLFQLGPDPFQFAAAQQGLAQRGTTPQAGYANELNAFSSQAIPTIDPNASRATIDQLIQSMTGGTGQIPGLPQAPTFGMAGGGAVSTFGPPMRFWVGEEGPEIMEVGQGGVRVYPHEQSKTMFAPNHAAQGVDISTILPALAPLWDSLGMGGGNAPTLERYGIGSRVGGIGWGSRQLGNMGFSPGLIRNSTSGATYWRDPTTQQYRHITSPDVFNQSKFNWDNVVNFDPAEAGSFDLSGSQLAGPPPEIPGGSMANSTGFGPYGTVSNLGNTVGSGNLGGYIIPAAFRVASALNQLKMNNPALYNIILSGYRQAGIPSEFVESQMQMALPSQGVEAAQRRLIGFR